MRLKPGGDKRLERGHGAPGNADGANACDRLAAALETMSPMLEATKAAWCAADAELGSGADHTAIIRWLESLQPPKGAAEESERVEGIADA